MSQVGATQTLNANFYNKRYLLPANFYTLKYQRVNFAILFHRRAILSNPDVIEHTPIKALFENDFWGTPLSDSGSHGSYRPLCVATYRLNYAFSGFKPWSYHFLNIMFHCTATALVVTTAKRLLPAYCMRVGTAVAGLTFAAHPIHTEAVAGVVGRADLAACNLFLLSFLLYSEHMRLREARHRKQCRQIVKDNPVRRQITSDTTFRLSCHGLVQQIMMNFRRLLKASRAGPLKFFDACVVKSGPIRSSKCLYSDSASDTGELLQWLTLAGTLLFAVAATLCKEPAIMVLPLCIFYDFLKGTRREDPYSKVSCTIFILHLSLLRQRKFIPGTNIKILNKILNLDLHSVAGE